MSLLLMTALLQRILVAQPSPAAVIKEAGYHLISPPSRNIQLRGLLVPGHELYGTVFADTVAGSYPMPVRQETLKLAHPSPISRSSFSASALGCANAHISILGWKLKTVTIPSISRSEEAAFLTNLAADLHVPEDQLRPYVVVTAIATPIASVVGCRTVAENRDSESAIAKTVWAYKAGVAMPSMEATQRELLLKVLSAFELDSAAASRNIRIPTIDAKPIGAALGWIDLVGAGGRNATALPDEDFRWFAAVPTPPQNLWPGRFFFRIKAHGAIETKMIDLTLADDGQKLNLALSGEAK